MAFYLLVVALFTVRLHRRSATIALGLAAVSVAFGGLLPVAFLSRTADPDLVIVLAVIVMVLAVGCAMSSRPALRSTGAVLGGVLAAVLVVLNGRIGPWHGLIILAVMFTGTVIYRAEHGQISRRYAALTTAFVLACALATGIWHGAAETTTVLAWISAIVLAAISFALAMALRRRRLPRWLTGLGLISYSVYLLHPVLLMVTDVTIGRWRQDNLAVELGFLAVLLLLSWAAQRYVEAPGQRWGRHLARRTHQVACMTDPVGARQVP
jgi:peptidoglycan/LPS O-acetylase OafA/YrhL